MKTTGLFKALFVSALVLTTASAHAEGKKWDKITIATEGAFRPYNFTKPDGTLDGYEVDLYKDLCARMKVECTMVAQPFDGIIPALNAGKFDAIMAGLTATPKREETIDFTVSYGLTPQTFATLKDSPFAKLPHTGETLYLARMKKRTRRQLTRSLLKSRVAPSAFRPLRLASRCSTSTSRIQPISVNTRRPISMTSISSRAASIWLLPRWLTSPMQPRSRAMKTSS